MEEEKHMDFLDCVKGRRSVRVYKPDPVSHEDFEDIVALASYAPSWKNLQRPHYVLVERDLRHRIADECLCGHAGNSEIVLNAPSLVILTTTRDPDPDPERVLSDPSGTHWPSFDAGLAAQTFCLAAYYKGLGTVIMGIFDAEKTAVCADVSADQRVAALIALGVPDESPKMLARVTLAKLVAYRD
jgi:nitroreductase